MILFLIESALSLPLLPASTTQSVAISYGPDLADTPFTVSGFSLQLVSVVFLLPAPKTFLTLSVASSNSSYPLVSPSGSSFTASLLGLPKQVWVNHSHLQIFSWLCVAHKNRKIYSDFVPVLGTLLDDTIGCHCSDGQ